MISTSKISEVPDKIIEDANKIVVEKLISIQQTEFNDHVAQIDKQVNISSYVAFEQDFYQHLPLNLLGT
ncbi:hypothetical protein NQ317_002356 [Molorchus minor]|uniref:Uncharacterized protein n=1 Tax=Molorchus minor TaxID=1323400 RepID=A0ABQ9JV35_9CUCU|nr:hypothetical protein NQ317_002356 [Molorchus minor]